MQEERELLISLSLKATDFRYLVHSDEEKKRKIAKKFFIRGLRF